MLERNFGLQIWWKFQWTSKSRLLVENSKIREHFRCNYSFLIKNRLKKIAVWHRKYCDAPFLFLIFYSGGLLFLIFCSVLISGALQVNFIPKKLRKVLIEDTSAQCHVIPASSSSRWFNAKFHFDLTK